MAGISKELWLPIVLEGFYPDNSFMLRSRNLSEFVENNKLNIAEAGGDPKCLIDNTTYPVPVVERTDNPHEILLRTLDTENTVVRNIEAKEASYNKMESVVRGHRNSLNTKAGKLAAFNWTPASNSANTPVLKTSGGINKESFKDLTFEDIEDLEAKYNNIDAPENGRILVVSPLHMAGLKRQDRKLYKEIIKDKKLFTFNLFMYSQCPFFDCTTGVKQAFQSIANANSASSSFSYLEDEVGRAIGSQDMFVQYASPTERGDVVGFQMRFTAVPLRNKYLGAVYSVK